MGKGGALLARSGLQVRGQDGVPLSRHLSGLGNHLGNKQRWAGLLVMAP